MIIKTRQNNHNKTIVRVICVLCICIPHADTHTHTNKFMLWSNYNYNDHLTREYSSEREEMFSMIGKSFTNIYNDL